MRDLYARRSGDDYAAALAALLPVGHAWPRDPQSPLMRLVSGLAQVWGSVDGKAGDLLQIETDPRRTYELLAEWERAFGLPDPVAIFTLVTTTSAFQFGYSSFGGSRGRIKPPASQQSWSISGYGEVSVGSLAERRRALVNKITMQGGQSRAFFLQIASNLGYNVTIREFSPFQFGTSSFGGAKGQIQPPSVRFYWSVSVFGPRVSRFQFGASSFGRDRILSFRTAKDLESIFRKWKPAHTELIFNYGALPKPKIVRFEFGDSQFGNDPILKLAA